MKPKKKAAPVAPAKATPPATATENNKPDIFSQNKKAHLKDIESKALEKENKPKGGLASLAGAPSFKAGGALPTLDDDFPPVAKKAAAAVKFNDQFDEAFDDEFSEGDPESPNEANNEDEDEDEDGDFDANELLNMNSYQQKRAGMGNGLGRDKESPLPSL